MSPTCEETEPMTANSEPAIHVERDEAGTNVEHDTHDNAY